MAKSKHLFSQLSQKQNVPILSETGKCFILNPKHNIRWIHDRRISGRMASYCKSSNTCRSCSGTLTGNCSSDHYLKVDLELTVSDWVRQCLCFHLLQQTATHNNPLCRFFYADDFSGKAEFILRVFIIPFIGTMRLYDVRRNDILELISRLSAVGMKMVDCERLKYVLFILFQAAVDWHIIAVNPVLIEESCYPA